MLSKINYELAIDARWVGVINRGIGTFVLNLISHNKTLSSSDTILFILKSSESFIKHLNIKYKVVNKYFLISDMEISFFLRINNIKCFLSPGNILPVFPLVCDKKF